MIQPAEIRQWPLPDKLALLEVLWTELSVNPDEIEVPEWHRDVLASRQADLEHGKVQVLDWENAKEQIRRARP